MVKLVMKLVMVNFHHYSYDTDPSVDLKLKCDGDARTTSACTRRNAIDRCCSGEKSGPWKPWEILGFFGWSMSSRWWFGTFFIFPYIGNNHPNWLIFFRGVAQPPTRCYDDTDTSSKPGSLGNSKLRVDVIVSWWRFPTTLLDVSMFLVAVLVMWWRHRCGCQPGFLHVPPSYPILYVYICLYPYRII